MRTLTDIAREFRIRRLSGKANCERRESYGLDATAVSSLTGPLDHSAFDQALQKSKARGFEQTGAFDQLPQSALLFLPFL
jgi:hypothetical protein